MTTGDDEAVVEALEKSHAKSQGFLLDSKTRRAIENYVMEVATKHFASQGYSVEDHHKGHPYDLLCQKKNERLYVEVKGTVTRGDDVILTSGEVKFARSHMDEMGLFVLHSIQVSNDGKLSDGNQKMIVPWGCGSGESQASLVHLRTAGMSQWQLSVAGRLCSAKSNSRRTDSSARFAGIG